MPDKKNPETRRRNALKAIAVAGFSTASLKFSSSLTAANPNEGVSYSEMPKYIQNIIDNMIDEGEAAMPAEYLPEKLLESGSIIKGSTEYPIQTVQNREGPYMINSEVVSESSPKSGDALEYEELDSLSQWTIDSSLEEGPVEMGMEFPNQLMDAKYVTRDESLIKTDVEIRGRSIVTIALLR